MIKLHDLEFEPFISEGEITKTIERISAELNKDYGDKRPLFLGVLNGSFMFASEVVKRFEGDCEISFVKLGSYEGTESTGKVKTLLGLNQDLKGRNVILLEDIVDTGNTLVEIDQILKQAEVEDYKVVTLFYKPEAYKKSIPVDYVGMEIPNKFIVGFGLDYDGLGRNLTQVYKRKENKMTNLVLFGPPGAGKGTQATILKDKYNLVHISTGDVFRYNIKNQTELGLSAKSYIDKGQLVPDEVTINMLKAEVEKNEDANGFIFDGFPRTEAQADALSDFLESKGTKVHAMIALEVEDNILVERLLERGKTSGRPDDADEAVIRNRIKVYYNETAILKNYYQKQDRYFGVDGVGSIEEITERLSIVIDKLMK
ncbi:adenylate kinase [Gramella jeungdoensis]|uniref:Adenylate kinase n=1 Tax=Gramella jeungdoensis TaxID=708091 RepID=A0ABT0YWE7_9FLAO|nr:adenylate kinase [Gramella jeungdoensis]MCM8567783.1 adenylate kinase [Gramella jeungdoensis]